MGNIPPSSGWQWIKQGFALFRRQPAEMSTLFAFYVLINAILILIPLIGSILLVILRPAFSMALMQACADIECSKRVYPKSLFSGLRTPSFKPLATLGMLYLLAGLLAMLVANLVDGGVFLQAASHSATLDPTTPIDDPNLTSSLLCALGVYFPISILLWFASPLIAWQNMSVGKAIFFSVFTVKRAIKALCVYFLGWATISILLLWFIDALLSIVTDNVAIGLFILLPFTMLLMVVMQCSFYPSYTQLFGTPGQQDEAPNEAGTQ